MQLKLIVFDWDGTLMDSAGNIITAMQRAFEKNGFAVPTPNSIRSIIGLSLAKAVFQLDPALNTDQAYLVENEYRREFAVQPESAQLFAGAKNVLQHCTAKNIELAIATGKSSAGLQHALQESGTGEFFTSIRTADDCGSKPSPQMLQEILSETGFNTEDALMIGDTTFDLQMAINAGVDSIAACYGAHEREELAKHKPLSLLDSITDLPEKLNDIYDV